MAQSNPTYMHRASPRLKLLAQSPACRKGFYTGYAYEGRWEKKISLMWYPMGGCSVHKPPFVRGPHVVQRALCPQGRPTAVKTKRDTGKASGSLCPSEKLSSVRLFKGRLWPTRGVWIKNEIHWKRQRGELARCKSSHGGSWAGSRDNMPAHGAPGRGQSCSGIK